MDGPETQEPLPAGTGSGASISPRWRALAIWLGGALVLLVALFVRGRDLEGGVMSPDDGLFLHSARVRGISEGLHLQQWIKEDAAWLGLIAEDFGEAEQPKTFQHSYLHQLTVRYALRAGRIFGFGSVTALRIDQAILGSLTALLESSTEPGTKLRCCLSDTAG